MKKNWKYKRKVKEKKSESKTAEKVFTCVLTGRRASCLQAAVNTEAFLFLTLLIDSTTRQPLLTASREGHTSSKHLRTFITCRGQTETVITSTKTPGSASPC